MFCGSQSQRNFGADILKRNKPSIVLHFYYSCGCCFVLSSKEGTPSVLEMNKLEDLLHSIKNKMEDFEISLKDLKAPTPRFVQSYFSRLLLELGFDVEEFQVNQEQRNDMTCYDSVKHVMPVVDLFGAVKYIASDILSTNDFSIQDLLHPSYERTLSLLNVFDWFHTYADYKAGNVGVKVDKVRKKKEELEELKLHLEKIKTNMINEDEECSMIPVYRKEIEEGKLSMMQKKKELVELKEKVAKAQMESDKAIHAHRTLTSEHVKLEEAVKHFQNQLKLASDIEQFKSKRKDYHEKKETCEKKKQYLGDVMQMKSQKKNMMENYLPSFEQCKEKLKTYLELQKEMKLIQDELKAEERKKASMSTEMKEIRDRIAKVNSKEKLLEEQKMTANTALEEENFQYNLKIQDAEKEVDELMTAYKTAQFEIEEITLGRKEQMEEIQRLKELDEKLVKDFYEELEEKIAKNKATLKHLGLLD